MSIRVLAWLTVGAGLVLAAGCGGGEGETSDPGGRISDPAKVPTSTPVRDAPVYRIRGDTVQAPSGATAVAGQPTGGGGRTYTVQAGDTCDGIARQHNVTAAQLIAANRDINEGCTNLRQGEELRIPDVPGAATPGRGSPTPGGTVVATATLKPASGRTYTVQTGDNCFDIAASYNIKVSELVALNGLDAGCTGLKVGQVLKIP